jgi:tetratricopeptide (TPR) repeat protein
LRWEFRRAHKRGLAYSIDRDFDKGIGEYNEALRLRPNDSLAYIKRGRAYVAKRQFDKAITDENAALRLCAGTDTQRAAEAYCVRGWAYGEMGDYDKAIADENESIYLNPDDPGPYYHRAKIYEARGDQSKADADRKRERELEEKAVAGKP